MYKRIVTLFSFFLFILLLGSTNETLAATSSQTKLLLTSPEGICDTATIPWTGEKQTIKDKVVYYTPAFTGISTLSIETHDADNDIKLTVHECKYGSVVKELSTGINNNDWSKKEVSNLDPDYYYWVDYYYWTVFGDSDEITPKLVKIS